ncbi:MAG: glutathione S-transferase family protein [Alphaproteobacteria bacterium]|nr:MAG: glutathione S-transferase family protein [Alphaproteobacteria bacterium]
MRSYRLSTACRLSKYSLVQNKSPAGTREGKSVIKVFGLKVSYFTGKLEGYLRYKEIPYEYCPATVTYFMKVMPSETGAMQMPAVQLEDGRWMTDTSPMIDWFEDQYPEPAILPEDPVQGFVCRLIEDYADEWLWRPAMHYRWSYPLSSKLLRRQIIGEMAPDVPGPDWIKWWRTERRQHRNFVKNDGVTPQTWGHVEQSYLRLLDILSNVFESRPFVFGDRPSLADIGLFGPLFRHFSMDPVPAIIMRESAPAVMEWVYRLWNARASKMTGGFVSGVPEDLLPLVKEIGETHLENLNANALAWQAGQEQFGVTLQGATYQKVPVSRYRVWCLEMLQKHFQAVPGQARKALGSVLDGQGCLEPLQRLDGLASGYDPDGQVPFGNRSLPVYEKIV